MVPVKFMTISNSSIKVVNGFSGPQLSVSVSPLNASNKSVKWVSSNPAIVTVDAHGHTYGKSVGTAVITAYTTDGSCLSQSCIATVEEYIPVESITFLNENECIPVGSSWPLVPIISPENATNKDLIWSIGDSTVVSVDGSGLVTTIKGGTTTIRATSVSNPEVFAETNIYSGYETQYRHNSGNILFVASDYDMFEDEKDELLSALYVFVGEKLVSTAIKESDDTISVDITEIGPLLCKENDFVYANGQYACSVKHVNSDIVYSKTYNESALNLCPISNKRVRISLKTLIEDLGYSEKCASNGSIVVIQGYNVDSTATASEITGEDIMSLYYSLLPIVGDAKDLIEGHYGRDIITGERFSAFDRVLCIAFSIVPFFADTGVRVGKKGFVKIDTLVDLMGKLHVDKKTDLITDIWRTLKPATRDFCFEELFSKTIYTLSNGWHHVGKEMNGCFPVIDFVKVVDNKLDDTIAVSLKTLDPDRYLKSDGLPNIENIQAVLESYIKKIKDTKMFVINDILGNVEITQKQLDIVVPSMRVDVFDSFKDLLRECGIKVEIIPC